MSVREAKATAPAYVYAPMRIAFIGLLVLVACSGREPEPERARTDPAPPTPSPTIPPAPSPPIAPDPTAAPEAAATEPAPPIEAPSGRFSVTSHARQHGGHRFTVRPAGITFELPWPHTDEIATGAQLSRMRECGYEWDREYARIANAALPFDALALHVGAYEFCEPGLATDMHARVYILEEPAERVVRTIAARATAEAALVSRYTPPQFRRRAPGGPRPADVPGWTHVPVVYSVFYGDYGGSAALDFFVRRIGEHTVVFLFMYVDRGDYGEDPVEAALTSVRAI